MEKKCRKCGITKDISRFAKLSRNKDGLDAWCKDCRNKENKRYRDNNPEKLKNARKKNYLKNIEKMRENKRAYYKSHTLQKSIYDKKYRADNAEKIRKYKKDWEQRNKDNIKIRIKNNLRRRIHHLVKDGYKSDKTEKLIGCSFDYFISYIESLFQEGMNWNNYGHFGWHIDHIRPCSSFDLTKESEQKECFNYKNMQPLWWQDNLKKSSKWKRE